MKLVHHHDSHQIKDQLLNHFYRLSDESSELRFFGRKSKEGLKRWVEDTIDHATYQHHWLIEVNDQGECIAVGQLTIDQQQHAEIAISVHDDYQGQGRGKKLIKKLIDVAKDCQCKQINVCCLPRNQQVRHVLTQMGFDMTYVPGECFYGQLSLL